jgi:hypothetical protein
MHAPAASLGEARLRANLATSPSTLAYVDSTHVSRGRSPVVRVGAGLAWAWAWAWAWASAWASLLAPTLALGACARGERRLEIAPDDASPRDPLDDPSHCGARRVSCEGGACFAGRCRPVRLAEQGLNPLAVGGGWLFYFVQRATRDGFDLLRVPIAGGAPLTLARVNYPQGVAADATHVYWLDENPSTVHRRAHSGGPSTVVATPPDYERAWSSQDPIAIAHGYAYWGEEGGITRMPVAGGPPARVSTVRAIAFDFDGDRLIANDQYDVHAIALDGSAPVKIAGFAFDHRDEHAVEAVVVDGAHAYFGVVHQDLADPEATMGIGRAPLTGGKAEIVVPFVRDGVAFTVLGGEIFWNKQGSPRSADVGLHRCAGDGSHDVVLEAGLSPWGFVHDDRRIFFAASPGGVFKLVR